MAASPSSKPRADEGAQASAVETVFKQFGLFGTWAVDCGRPASPTNPHVTVARIGAGPVTETHELGPGSAPNRYSVLSAARLSGDRVAMQVIFRPGAEFEERQRLEIVVRAGTRRTMYNQPEGQPVRVKNGVALAFGFKTPLLWKCG